VLNAAADATNAVVAEEATYDLAHCPRALLQLRAKGLRLQLPVLHDFQDESRLRTLTVKLRGRPEAPDRAPRAHNLSRARGANTPAVHGPLQRLLGANTGLHVASTGGTVLARAPKL
jgi:hypothetical protein